MPGIGLPGIGSLISEIVVNITELKKQKYFLLCKTTEIQY